jgi:hypothetical protein
VAALNVRIAETFGTLGKAARITINPLLSFFSVILGRFSGLAAPGGGGVFCCAKEVQLEMVTRMIEIRSFI